MNTKKLFIVSAIIFFPITILFSPIIILLFDIRSRLHVINSLSEQILIQVRTKNENTTETADVSKVVSLVNDFLLTQAANRKKGK